MGNVTENIKLSFVIMVSRVRRTFLIHSLHRMHYVDHTVE